MLVDEVELTLSHVDLGHLDEQAAMILFANAHSHCLTAGTGHTLRDVTDAQGATLYGGYYWTHLTVPPGRRLEQHRVWDRVAVGVDVRVSGSLLLSSSYVLGRPGEVDPADPARWDHDGLPSLRAGNTFFVDGIEGERRPSAPRPGALAALPKHEGIPASLDRFREQRARASIDPAFDGPLRSARPIAYPTVAGRDLRPGHAIMFARYIQIADTVERAFLTGELWPPLPRALADCLSVLERETFYFANARGEPCLRGTVRGRLSRCAPDLHGPDRDVVSGGLWTAISEIYDEDNVLLVTSRVRKLLAVPRAEQRLVTQAERIMATHAT